ncbi:MAG: CHAT domain-containing protein, partial [Cyanobacteria bacterium P01_F01_bin.153]
LEVADRSRARSLIQFLTPSTDDQPRDPLNIKQIKRLARDKNATLITYSIVEKDLHIWVVSPNGDLNFAKANPEETGIPISQVVRGSRAASTSEGTNNLVFAREQYRMDLQAMRGNSADGPRRIRTRSPEHLERGYDLLIKPIEQYLPEEQKSRLIIVPHRELGTVPFTALFKKGQGFLIDRYTITVTPSLQTLHTLQEKTPTATGGPLVVGNPSPMVGKLTPLPGTETEATAIAQKLNTTPILGEQATEATIKPKLENASILHLATHGVLQKSDRDTNSWLALANPTPDDTEDNRLTISEIFSSNLNAQVAVLSACDTNSGQTSGEGVVSLARAFLKAGVPTVVASSWKVPDQQTRLLMEEFYDQLLAGKTYAEALRAAQLKVRAQFPNPYYWAAFTVIGEGDRTLELP